MQYDSNKPIEQLVWKNASARTARYRGTRKHQVGPGKFPRSWFESMQSRTVIEDRSEVIGEPDWIPEIQQHCIKRVPWLHTTESEVAQLHELCETRISWNNIEGPPGKYVDIVYINSDAHPTTHSIHQQIIDRVGAPAENDPMNIGRVRPHSAMFPHRDTPLRWCCLYLALPAPGQIYAPTEHLWDNQLWGVKDWEPGVWYIFNQDIWHNANNFTDQHRYALQLVLNTSYEDFVSQHT